MCLFPTDNFFWWNLPTVNPGVMESFELTLLIHSGQVLGMGRKFFAETSRSAANSARPGPAFGFY